MTAVPLWFAVQTQPHAEAKAAAHLDRQGFVSYLPRYLKRRRHARKTEFVPAPLYPRYLFVSVDMAAQRWHAVRSTIGVTRLVCNGDVPAPVPERAIEELRARQQADGFLRLEAKSDFSPGDKVKFLEGPFSACLGLFETVTDNERVSLLLDLLGRKVRVVADSNLVGAY